ncbi:MAG: hypothetical protein ABIP53_05820 [Candidatus Limnocylindrales bacterium]
MSISGRCSPEHREVEPLRLERVGGGAPRGRIAVGLVAVVLVVATLWLKPWGADPPTVAVLPTTPFASPTPTPLTPASPTQPPTAAPQPTSARSRRPLPTPVTDPLVLAARRRQCQSATNWRMVTAETTATRRTRTMYAADPVAASGPSDPTLPTSRLFALALRGVGVCVPRTPVMSPVDELMQVILWQVDSDGEAHEVARPVILDEPLFEIGEAYYGPPSDEGELWPAGRYAFEIKRIAGGRSRWMALEFIPTDETGAVANL